LEAANGRYLYKNKTPKLMHNPIARKNPDLFFPD